MPRTWAARLAACLLIASIPATASAADLPPDVALVPGDAAGFVRIDVPAVANSPLGDDLRFALAGLRPGEFEAFAKKFSFDPAAVERVVFVLPTGATALAPVPDLHPTAVSAVAVVTFAKPFDPVTLLRSVYAAGRPKSYRGRVYQFDEDTWSGVFALPGNRSFVVGAEDSLVWLIDRMDAGHVPGPLSAARGESAGHAAFAAFNPRAVLPAGVQLPPSLAPLAEASRVCLSVDLGKSPRAALTLQYADPAAATGGQAALKAAIGLLREKVRGVGDDLRAVIDRPGAPDRPLGPGELPQRFAALAGVGLLQRVDKTLETLPVERDGAAVGVAFDFVLPSGGLAVVGSLTAITSLGTNANATFQFVGNAIRPPGVAGPEEARLKKLGAAFDAYHADRGHYPPAATTAADGTPLLSWRVALLPYLGEKALYDQFRRDEQWDSLHNKKLLDRMPAAFNRPYAYPKNYGKTNALVVTGPGTPFGGPAGVKKADLGGANVVLAVEADASAMVYWSKPADLTFAPGRVPDPFGVGHFGSCHAVFTDGTTKRLTRQADGKDLPAMVVRPSK